MPLIDLAGLKGALSDVPGIDTLTETVVGGRRVYGFDGLMAAVDMSADQAGVEAAIRNAVAMRAQGQTAAVQSAPAQTAAPNSIVPAPSITPIPTVAIIPPTPVPQVASMSVTGAAHVGTSLKDMLTQRKAKIAAAHDKISANFDKLDEATTALDTLGDKIGAEADDLKAMVGQFTNDLG